MSRKIELINSLGEEIHPATTADLVKMPSGLSLEQELSGDMERPTVTHKETSFKVGVGDSDVSASVVDGFATHMIIKGRTYQNILPEPSTHVLSNNKEIFKVNEGLDPNVEIVDGVSKSAILKGQTLVNLAPKKTIDYVASTNWDGYYQLVQSSRQSSDTWRTSQDLKPNTRYYISCYVEAFEDANGQHYRLNNTNDNCVFTNNMSITGVGHYQWLSTTISEFTDATYIALRCQNVYSKGAIKIRDIMIIEYQEGMENWNIPYFEGMTSCKVPVLRTVGKNLFKPFRTYTTKGLTFTITNGQLYVDGTATDTVDYYLTTKGSDGGTYDFINNNIPVGTTLTLSNNLGLRNHFGYYLDGVEKDYWGSDSLAIKSNTSNIRCFVRFLTGQSFSNQPLNIQLEQGTVATSYEPYKSNILHTPEEVVLRSLPNGVCDTLNLNTGEYVQRIGEKMLKGASNEGWIANYKGASYQFVLPIEDATSVLKDNKVATLNSDTIPSVPNHTILTEELNVEKWGIAQRNNGNKGVFIAIPASAIETYTVESFKQWLAQNPITVQYELATPIIKTVDLSSSGNWEKVVLDGSEGWQCDANSETGAQVYIPRHQGQKFFNSLKSQDGGGLLHDLKNTNYFKVFSIGNNYGMTVVIDKTNFPINIGTNITLGEVRELWKQWLSQNPITVWYQTQTHQDSTQVKQPIFFKGGHIIQSSGADHSLIPILDYQAKTRNSYVMDLMKTNTRYTMKAKSASGTFTIDGTSYGAGTNGTFTTPSSMTNKFLVMSNKTNEEVMILEGDVVSKTIPYFKGIKSAFEDESKIEVLSTGKNLFNIELVRGAHGYGAIGGKPELSNTYTRVTNKSGDYILVKPNTKMTFTINNNIYTAIAEIDKDGNRLGDSGWRSEGRITITTKPNTKFIGFNFRKSDNSDITVDEVYQASPSIEESPTQTFYEPYKSNSAKIPLLSSFNVSSLMEMGTIDSNGLPSNSQTSNRMRTKDFIEVDSLHTWKYSHNTVCWVTVHYYDSSRNYISNSVYENTSVFELKLPSNCKYIKLKVDSDIANVFVVEPTLVKIGLHSLRSLPNSVHDEIILDRENGKAQIVQRVNKIILDGSENGWFKTTYVSGEVVEFAIPCTNVNGLGLCNNMMIYGDTERIVYASDKIYIRILKTKANNIETFRNHLQSNPTIVYCELATPIITEADLEGFPYIYKDGHIFLNSEISPVTAITYNTSTAHRIESQNEIIIRHEAKLTELEKLMVNGILETEYQRCLLTLDIQTTL